MKKPIALIGTFIKKIDDALNLAEKKSKHGETFSVVEIEGWHLVVNDKIYYEATK